MEGAVIVIGNGHVKQHDKDWIDAVTNASVVRFNDMKGYNCVDRVTFHVSRIPSSWPSLCTYNALQWYVTPFDSRDVPPDANRTFEVYETWRGLNSSRNTWRIFNGCETCNMECYHNASDLGPSTGAVILSYLQANEKVTTIYVFGMNWKSRMKHIDFVDDTIVRRCCTKCVFHETSDNLYGNELFNVEIVTSTTLILLLLFGITLKLILRFPVLKWIFRDGKHTRLHPKGHEEVRHAEHGGDCFVSP